MTSLRDGLLLEYRMDNPIAGNKLKDTSGHHRDGTVHGDPKLVKDAKVGWCLRFDGVNDYISLPAPDGPDFKNIARESAAYAVSVWINADVFIVQRARENFDVEMLDEDNQYLTQPIFTSAADDGWLKAGIWESTPCLFDVNLEARLWKAPKISAQKWVHLCWTRGANPNPQTSPPKLFINGRPATIDSQHSLPLWSPSEGEGFVGCEAADMDTKFRGKMAGLCVYGREITAQEAKQLHQQANASHQTAAASGANPFYQAYPIGFEIHDANDEPVIYVSDDPVGPESQLHVTLSNAWTKPVYLKGMTANSKPTATKHHFELRFRPHTLSANSLKNLGLVANAASKNWLVSKPSKESSAVSVYLLHKGALTLEKAQQIALTLKSVSAEGQSGSHGSRVELRCNPNSVFYDPGYSVGINEIRAAHLNIVNHRGKKHLPLHAGFIGPTLNRVLNDNKTNNKLIVRFTNTSKQPLSLTSSTAGETRFELSAHGGKEDWSLGEVGQVDNIKVEIGGTAVKKSAGKLGQASGFTVSHKTASKLPKTLEAGKSFDLSLTDIVTSHPAGLTNLNIGYRNIPGYWDGEFVLPIEKTPLILFGKHVGIGTVKPGKDLSIANGSAEIGKDLHVGNKLTLGDKLTLGAKVNGEESTLTVNGGVAIGNQFTQSAPNSGLLVQGNVGIGRGTPAPKTSLTVRGGVVIGKHTMQPAPKHGLAVEGDTTIDGVLTLGKEVKVKPGQSATPRVDAASSPIVVRRYEFTQYYTPKIKNVTKSGGFAYYFHTEYSIKEYVAVIAGFSIDGCGSNATNRRSILHLMMRDPAASRENKWVIEFYYDNGSPEAADAPSWLVDVMFIHRSLAFANLSHE